MSFLDAHLDAAIGDLQVDLPLHADAGEVIALLGPNGAGKSTVVRVLAGLWPARSGHLRVGDRVLHDLPDTWLPPEQRHIGVLFQQGRLFGHMSVLENVAFGLRARGTPADAARQAARQQLAELGLEDLADRRAARLSGGQAQRVALARVLVTEPELLLLDEPTSAQDAGSRMDVLALLRRQLADFHGAAVVITHDLQDAVALADRIVVIENGSVVQRGTPAEVVREPRTKYVADLVGTTVLSARRHADNLTFTAGGTLSLNGAASSNAPTNPVNLDAEQRHAGAVQVSIPPRAVLLLPDARWRGHITDILPQGNTVLVTVDVAGVGRLVSEIGVAVWAQHKLARGADVGVAIRPEEVAVYEL